MGVSPRWKLTLSGSSSIDVGLFEFPLPAAAGLLVPQANPRFCRSVASGIRIALETHCRQSPEADGNVRRVSKSEQGALSMRDTMRWVWIAGVLLAGVLALGRLTAMQRLSQSELGDPLPGLTDEELQRFMAGKQVFERVFTPETGLGPLFNSSSCAECHENPVSGGTGDESETHATHFTPPATCDLLEAQGGPVFQQHATPSLEAAGISKEQVPPHAQVGGRSTPPIFGFGLLDAIPDETILEHQHRSGGRAHRLEDGRVGRFGRKARVASLLEFNAGAFLQEQGVTNALNPNELLPNGHPLPAGTDPAADPELSLEDLLLANDFVRFLAPPPRKPPETRHEARTILRGQGIFFRIGCATCHTPAMRTGPNPIAALDRQVIHLYSDLLLHNMGPDLADICLGDARPDEFRTAPLMGLRFLTQFLHDGRATTVLGAIQLHGGQAAAARAAFEKLRRNEQEALLTFLASL